MANSRKQAIVATVLSSLLILVAAVLVAPLALAPEEILPEPILVSAESPTQEQVIVHRAELGSSMTLEFFRPGFSFAMSSSRGGSTGSGGIQLRRKVQNGKLTEVSVEMNNHVPLILLTSVFDADGVALSGDGFIDGFGHSRLLKFDPNGSVKGMETAPKGESPDVLFEVEDGDGGWLPTIGPLAMRDQAESTFVLASRFPRDQQAIRFRATFRETGAVVEFEVPNPAPANPTTWTADPEPWKKSFDGGSIEIESVKVTSRGNLHANYVLKPLPGSVQPENAYGLSNLQWTDDLGNTGSSPPLPRVKMVRWETAIGASDHYRYERNNAELLASLPWPSVASLETAAGAKPIGNDAALGFGLDDFQIHNGTTESRNNRPIHVFKVTLKGRMPRSDAERFADQQIVVFFGEEPLSAGICRSSSSSRTGHHNVTVSRSVRWSIPEDELPAEGTPIYIGSCPSFPSETVQFTIPVDRIEAK